ncbi:VOC family protein [Bacillus sp. REN3]|uniref:VOC family protein n=1 Tax=Bacillus sp. REN3 TaxID=2802440 RepID=UPI001AED92D9|nr:VOC family protein [Bacillus sp. REN3]
MIATIYPYLVTNGNGQEAVKFYEDALGAEVLNVQTFGDLPDNPEHPTPPEAKELVLNAHLKVGNTDLMLSDTYPGMPYQLGDQVSVAIIVETVEDARKVFGKLEAGGKVGMPLQQTFWSPLYGLVTDRFGVAWHVSAK